jgi:hypothetical protein
MGSVQGSRVASAVKRLEPGSRALLDLSLRQGIPDDRIGRFLGAEAGDVRRRRAALLKRLAFELELSGIEDRAELRHELERLPADAWLDGNGFKRRRASASKRPAVLAAGLLVLAVCLLVLAGARWLLAGSSGGDATPVAAAEALAPLPGPETNLDWLGGPETAVARARLVGDATRPRIELVLAGLGTQRRALYEAWLYNSRIDAVSLARWRAGEGGLELRLPTSWRRYRSLDVSLEPPGGDVPHGGRSLLRAPLERLLPP